ncbi:MAG: PP2C family protein-serine/threonine phosphatase [Candidatus Sulfotelmatobacter sp.]|jgi:sigma-B regulation protein RsbU (phosphoserine phosphatase)
MCAPAPEMTADQVLQAFHRDAPNLFLGAGIVSVGLVAAAFSAIRRKLDPVLIYFALFAVLYGLRMWMVSNLMGLTMQGSSLYPRLSAALDFTVAIPAFLFFKAAGLLRRQATILSYALGIVLGSLALATAAFGLQRIFVQIANISIIAALIIVASRSIGRRSDNEDLLVIRPGLLIFVAFVLWENIRSALGLRLPDVEPIGFVVLLGTLGYVAARQTLQRDLQLSEIQKELEVARRMQLSILPTGFPNSANFHVAARYVPMTSVAGDFYDFIVADDRQAGLLIADVSGHGVPAALIASMVKVAATSQRANAADPARLLAGMNAVLFGNTQNQFVTAAYVHLDSTSRTLQYSAAGHPPMLLLRHGKVIEIAENGLILAAFDSATYTNAAHPLEPGDRLLLYTDGLIEAANPIGDFFGQDALSALLRQTADLPPSAASDQIISSVQRWSASQDDDLTVLICDYVRVN